MSTFKSYTYWVTLLVALSLTTSLNAKSKNEVSGKVTQENGQPLTGVEVMIMETKSRDYTNEKGNFDLKNIPDGTYTIYIRSLGFESYKKEVELNNSTHLQLHFTMKRAEYTHLEDVIVYGKTDLQKAKDQAVAAKVLDIKSIAPRPSTLTEIMNRTAGVRIRENGGLGSKSEISINGFQGNSVRFFKNGIPLSYLGSGYTISNLPLNTLKRVEIYKGVLPTSLGADALGGAVNLVTNTSSSSFLNVSYEAGSFNTHKVSAIGNYVNDKQGWFAGGEAFYNYSKNNYDVSVAVPDPVTKNPSRETVELFHNGYKGYYAEGHIGLKDKNWADMLKFSLTTYGIDREIQHPTLMNTPYGAITSHQESIVPTIRYKKSFFDSRLKIDQFFAYNTIHKNRIDTTHGNYDWYGHFNPNPSVTGESAKPSDSKVHFRHFTSRTNVSYDLSPKNELNGNLVVTNVHRKGKDPFGKKFHNTEIDILTIPATYMKTVAGLGWKYHILNRKLTNNLIVKYYGYRSKGADAYRATPTNPADIQKVNDHSWGIAEAVKYEVNTNNLLRLSIEYANRLPNQKELFGDGGTKVTNFDLTPERSLNLNLNYRLQKKKYYIETGLYYRQTADMIQLIPVQPPYAQYQNLKNVRGIGFDIDAMVQIWKFLSVSGNVTWNNNRMYNMTDPIDQWKEGSRLRNSPFFFYNLGINTNFNDVFTEKDHLKIYAHYNFIREFYLNFIPKDKEPDGFMGLWGESDVDITTKVPNQSLVSAGINYKIGLVPVNIGIEIKNITDAKLYDYYRVQKPGRSFQLKISYLLN